MGWKNHPKYLTVGCSQVDSFRKGIDMGLSEAQIAEEMLVPFKMSEPVLWGKAVHEAIEFCQDGRLWQQDDNGLLFYNSKDAKRRIHKVEIEGVLEYNRKFLPDMMHELWLPPWDMEYKGWEVSWRGKIDGLTPSNGFVHDHKVKSTFLGTKYSVEYLRNTQWRFYLQMSGMHGFQYHIYQKREIRIGDDPETPSGFIVEPYGLPITCYKYPDMEKELKDEILYFFQFMERNNMFRRLKDFKEEQKRQRYAGQID